MTGINVTTVDDSSNNCVIKTKGWKITLPEETSLDDTAGVVENKGLTSDCREE
jgi:hypothetical protein